MNQFDQFCKQYISLFKFRKGQSRKIGIEKEILVANAKGEMADISKDIWPEFKKRKLKYFTDTFYKDRPTGFFFGKDQITTDAGLGTFEFILEPLPTVQACEKRLKKLLRIVLPICEKKDLRLLGLGHQPITKPVRENWNRKQRYEILREVLGPPVDTATLSASDQAHIDVSPDEFIPVTNLMNGLSGFIIVLFANSPIAQKKVHRLRAVREMIWDYLGKERTGVPERPFSSIEDYFNRLWNLPCIMAQGKNGRYFAPRMSFRSFVKGFSPAKTLEAFANHEGALWICTRPRVYGTVEVRPACLQPWPDMATLPAFTLGIIENHSEAEQFLGDFEWKALYSLRYDALHKGFGIKIKGKPISRFLAELLDIAKRGLKSRKHYEESFLSPLYQRTIKRKAPAEIVIETFKKGGVPFLLDCVSLTHEHL